MTVSSSGDPAGTVTYYGRPILKEPVWIWAVPLYFYCGGAAGAAAALGAVAQSADRDELSDLITRCRFIAGAGTLVGTALLIHDLGRPRRFLNMLRVFRPTSAMSVGSWLLAAASFLSAGSAAFAGGRGMSRRVGDLGGLGAGVVGLPLSGYTAVLLSDTAVPLWSATRRSLPALFVASAMSSATSLLGFAELSRAEERIVHRLDLAAGAAELAAAALVQKEASEVEEVGRPLEEGVSASLWKASTALGVASLVLSLLPGHGRRVRTLGALLGTAGGLATRFAVFYAGKASARDPKATFVQQHAGHGGVDVRGG
ncbi:MAG: NrfD/PsrC family molybdoenzyme membrane anchor subunit [Actinomycetota bacterium]